MPHNNNTIYNMHYSTHTHNFVSIFQFFLCHEEPAVIVVCHLPVKVDCQSTLTLLLRRPCAAWYPLMDFAF